MHSYVLALLVSCNAEAKFLVGLWKLKLALKFEHGVAGSQPMSTAQINFGDLRSNSIFNLRVQYTMFFYEFGFLCCRNQHYACDSTSGTLHPTVLDLDREGGRGLRERRA